MSEAMFREVPPPKEAPKDDVAEALGIVRGLRVEYTNRQFRCASCHTMQPGGSAMIWVPDSVQRGDPSWSVTEAARQNAFNGCASGWCLDCARSLTPAKHPVAATKSLLKTLFGWFSE